MSFDWTRWLDTHVVEADIIPDNEPISLLNISEWFQTEVFPSVYDLSIVTGIKAVRNRLIFIILKNIFFDTSAQSSYSIFAQLNNITVGEHNSTTGAIEAIKDKINKSLDSLDEYLQGAHVEVTTRDGTTIGYKIPIIGGMSPKDIAKEDAKTLLDILQREINLDTSHRTLSLKQNDRYPDEIDIQLKLNFGLFGSTTIRR